MTVGATWVKLDDTFPDHPKMLAAGEDAAWLYVLGLCFSSRHLTDGHIPRHVLRRLTAKPRPERLAAALVSVGAWCEIDDGWVIHGYTEKQRTRERIEAQRERARERAARSRAKSRRDNGRTSREVTEPEKNSLRSSSIRSEPHGVAAPDGDAAVLAEPAPPPGDPLGPKGARLRAQIESRHLNAVPDEAVS